MKEALCKNEEFKIAFDIYYDEVRRNIRKQYATMNNNKRRKSIDETKVEKKSSDNQHKMKVKSRKQQSVTNKVNISKFKDGSLSLMNLGKQHRRRSTTSNDTLTTNEQEMTPKSDHNHNDSPLCYSDDSVENSSQHTMNSNDVDVEDSISPLQPIIKMYPLNKNSKHSTY